MLSKVIEFFGAADEVSLSSDSYLLVCNICPPIFTTVVPSETAFFRHKDSLHSQIEIDQVWLLTRLFLFTFFTILIYGGVVYYIFSVFLLKVYNQHIINVLFVFMT